MTGVYLCLCASVKYDCGDDNTMTMKNKNMIFHQERSRVEPTGGRSKERGDGRQEKAAQVDPDHDADRYDLYFDPNLHKGQRGSCQLDDKKC